MNSYCICGWLLAVTLFPVVCCMHMHNHNAVVDTPYCNVNDLLIHPSSSAFAFVLLFIVVVGRWPLLLLVDGVVQLFPLPAGSGPGRALSLVSSSSLSLLED